MGQTVELFEVRSMLPTFSIKRGRKGVLRLRDGTKKSDKLFNYSLGSTSSQLQVS